MVNEFGGTKKEHADSADALARVGERYAKDVLSAKSCRVAVERLTHAASVIGASGRDKRWAVGGASTDETWTPAEVALKRAQEHVIKKCRGK